MSTLVRSDGTQFVMQAYRELLSAKKRSQMVQEIRLLAEQQGQYVRLFNRGQGQYEAIFSTDPGYLLGESIWHYFNEADNLIYCEALPDSAQILVVVVRSGAVYIDSQILASNLQSELLPLMTGDLQYRIITSGNVPLRKAESFGTFRFPRDLLASFEILDEPLFPRLPALMSLQLQPLPLALKSEHLNLGLSTPTTLVLVMALIFGGWWLFTPQTDVTPLHGASLKKLSDPYFAYFQALSSPAPDQQLLEIRHKMNELYLLPGWRATQLSLQHQSYQIHLIPDGGEMRFLSQWANQRHYRFHLTQRHIELTANSALEARANPRLLYSSEQVVTRFVDQMNRLLHHPSVSLGASSRQGDVNEMKLTIHLDGASPDLLDLVSRQLKGLPMQLTSATINLHSGLMSGTIQLSVWGR